MTRANKLISLFTGILVAFLAGAGLLVIGYLEKGDRQMHNMSSTEFLTTAFTLACTVGPAIGFILALLVHALTHLPRRNVALTIGWRGADKKTEKTQ